MFSSLALSLLAVSPLLTNAIPAALEAKRALSGYQTHCSADTALTFDDGPYIYETQLVDELVAQGASATFFVNGYNWGCIYDEASVASLRHAYESGMTIASHTWNHYDITTQDTATLGHSLGLVETALWNILGVKPALFRPPYGSYNDEMVTYLNDRGYTVVGWDQDTGDSVGATVAASETVMNSIVQGDLVLSHETSQTTVANVIPDTLPGLVAKGVKFVGVDQCLGVPAYQAVRGSYGTRDATWTCDGTPVPGSGTARK